MGSRSEKWFVFLGFRFVHGLLRLLKQQEWHKNRKCSKGLNGLLLPFDHFFLYSMDGHKAEPCLLPFSHHTFVNALCLPSFALVSQERSIIPTISWRCYSSGGLAPRMEKRIYCTCVVTCCCVTKMVIIFVGNVITMLSMVCRGLLPVFARYFYWGVFRGYSTSCEILSFGYALAVPAMGFVHRNRTFGSKAFDSLPEAKVILSYFSVLFSSAVNHG